MAKIAAAILLGLFLIVSSYSQVKGQSLSPPQVSQSTPALEPSLTAANAKNLASNYLCMSLIRDKQGRTDEASSYAKKFVDLVNRQHTKKF